MTYHPGQPVLPELPSGKSVWFRLADEALTLSIYHPRGGPKAPLSAARSSRSYSRFERHMALEPSPHPSGTESEPRQRILENDEARAFVIYDARTGDVLAMHRLHAPAGLRAPADSTIEAQVLKCAAAALGRRKSGVGIKCLGSELPSLGGGIRVDPANGEIYQSTGHAGQDHDVPGTPATHPRRP